MANSNIIPELKTNVIRAIINDEDIVTALDPNRDVVEDAEDLIWNYIFPYNKNPQTVMDVRTFITVMVHTKIKTYSRDFVTPTLEIYIYSHNAHAEMDIRGIRDTRIDFIAKLIDEKFNGSFEYGGIGTLELTYNTEGTYNKDFVYRRLVFETLDINDDLCD